MKGAKAFTPSQWKQRVRPMLELMGCTVTDLDPVDGIPLYLVQGPNRAEVLVKQYKSGSGYAVITDLTAPQEVDVLDRDKVEMEDDGREGAFDEGRAA